MLCCFHVTGWEAMCTFLFSYNHGYNHIRGSKSWIFLTSAIIIQNQMQGSILIFCHWLRLDASYAQLTDLKIFVFAIGRMTFFAIIFEIYDLTESQI